MTAFNTLTRSSSSGIAQVRDLVGRFGYQFVLSALVNVAREQERPILADALSKCLMNLPSPAGRAEQPQAFLPKSMARKLAGDERGNTAVEFALCSLLVIPCILGGQLIGPALLAFASNLSAQIATAQSLLTCAGVS